MKLLLNLLARNQKTQIIGLRFFSIYGEWGRPDMLILKYLLAAKKRKILNYLIMAIIIEILLI